MLEGPEARPQEGARDERDYHSVEDFMSALHDLADGDLRRLGLQGAAYAYAAGCEGHDLVQEAIVATAGGARRWPLNVSLRIFLRMAMKSIASNRRRKEKKFDALDIDIADPTSDHADARAEEDEKMTRWEAQAFATIDDDVEAGLLFMSRLKGQSASDFRSEYGLSVKDLATISRRLSRKLNQCVPRGSK